MGCCIERIDRDGPVAESMLQNCTFVGAICEPWPQVQEHDCAERPDENGHGDEPSEPASPRREDSVDDPGEECQDDDRNRIAIFQNQPVHLEALFTALV